MTLAQREGMAWTGQVLKDPGKPRAPWVIDSGNQQMIVCFLHIRHRPGGTFGYRALAL
ncbi:hypothetical protein D3C78_1058360 [compost metagenome]